MSPFGTIPCATDLSAEADEAIRQADAFARAHGGKRVVFHALPYAMPSSPPFPQPTAGEAFVGLERQILRSLSERVAVLTSRVGAEVELRLGSGSVAEEVVRKAKCPVLVARR